MKKPIPRELFRIMSQSAARNMPPRACAKCWLAGFHKTCRPDGTCPTCQPMTQAQLAAVDAFNRNYRPIGGRY